jgi:hypothetical protein
VFGLTKPVKETDTMICATRRSCHCKGIMFVNGAQYKSHPLTANSPLRGRHTGACGAKSWRYNHWICEGGNSFMCCDCGTRRYESRKCVCVCVSVSYAQHHEACGEFHTFLTFVLDGSDLSLSCAIRFILSERALDAHRKGG